MKSDLIFGIQVFILMGIVIFFVYLPNRGSMDLVKQQDLGVVRSAYLPREDLTPGVLNPNIRQSNIKTTVCVPGYSKKIRPSVSWTAPREKQSIKDYGYADINPSHYEYDHRVPISISGAPRDIANLWAQPLTGEYNALMKDRLEYKVYRDLCAGKITLKQAQGIFLGDWTEAYDEILQTFGSSEKAIDPDDLDE